MEKINGIEKINLDVDFEPEVEIYEEEETVEEISLGEIEYVEEEYDFENTLEIDLSEVQ